MANMETYVLVFPLAADDDGVMLIEPEPWTHGPVQAGVGVDGTVQAVLKGHGVADPAPLICHSTSWHEVKTAHSIDGRQFPLYTQIDAYLTLLELPAQVVEQRWPAAIPVDPIIMQVIGFPGPHGPTRPPAEILQAFALLHGLRHLAFQVGPEGDSELRDALDGTPWRRHLELMRPELARMYRHDLTGTGAAAGW